MLTACFLSCSQRVDARKDAHPSIAITRGVYSDYGKRIPQVRGWELGRIAAKADTAFLIEHDIDKTMTLYRIVLLRVTDTVTQREKMAHVIAAVNLGHFWLFERNNPEQA